MAMNLTAGASVSRTQVIELHAGWNAVFLEVQPAVSAPGQVFSGLPVQTVACFMGGSLQEQYLRVPGDAPWKDEGWLTWYAPSQAQAFISNLYEIQTHRAYLIKATASFAWRITGEASTRAIQWYPNTCTFTGLPIDPDNAPTFKDFFAGSSAHQRLRIYRLQADAWKIVNDPAHDRPLGGEAFWIQTDGASTYQGQLRVQAPSNGQLDFDLLASEKPVSFANEGASDAQIRVESVADATGLPLATVVIDLGQRTRNSQPLSAISVLPSLAAGTGTTLRLALDRTALQADAQSTLLKITDGRGTQQWLPVTARRVSTNVQ